jgi:hypothetical protein
MRVRTPNPRGPNENGKAISLINTLIGKGTERNASSM